LWVLVPGVAAAQNEVGPTPPCGDVSNRLATTAFAQCAGGAIVLYATSFSGVTAGEQISACVAALPARGGICDARGVTSGATIPAITLANSGATVLGPCGLITVTGTIQIYNPSGVQGFRWLGCGGTVNNTGTSFTWAGNAIDPLFRIRGVRDSEFSYFGVNSSINAPLATAIRLETATGTTSTRRIFRDITINGTNSAVNGLTLGMQWCTGDNCGGAGGDANNDIDWVENATVINYFNTAFSIEGTQVKTIQFVNSQFSNGQRGVATNQGVIQAGSFRWKGGGGGSNTVADFDLGAPTDTIVIEGCNTEGSNRLLNIANATSSTFPITILGCRWAANNLNVDNFVVNYRDHGPLNLIGNSIEAPATSRTPKFQIDNGGGVSAGNAIGNSIAWQTSITVASQPFVCTPTPCWNTKGNILTNSSNVPQFMLYDYNAPGTLPTGNTGTCSTGVTVAGDARRGTWTSTAACALTTGTIILSGLPTQPTGYLCRMSDQTTAGVVIEETASGTTSVTFTVRALPTGTIQVAANDVLQYECSGY
jgi:hypothetical protein